MPEGSEPRFQAQIWNRGPRLRPSGQAAGPLCWEDSRGMGIPPNWAWASGGLPGSCEFTSQLLVLHTGHVKASAGRRYLQGSHEESRVLGQRQAQTVTAPGICPHWRQSQGEARS